jgi:hypothetical protein
VQACGEDFQLRALLGFKQLALQLYSVFMYEICGMYYAFSAVGYAKVASLH